MNVRCTNRTRCLLTASFPHYAQGFSGLKPTLYHSAQPVPFSAIEYRKFAIVGL